MPFIETNFKCLEVIHGINQIETITLRFDGFIKSKNEARKMYFLLKSD